MWIITSVTAKGVFCRGRRYVVILQREAVAPVYI